MTEVMQSAREAAEAIRGSMSALARFPDLPEHMRGLKVDSRGFPVPWFVAWVDGEPVFPVVESEKMGRTYRLGLCWVCGGALGRWKASVIGPMCAINRTISEPQSHVDCAQFSARRCPFLSQPNMKRVPGKVLPEARKNAAGLGIARNPGVTCVWVETARTTPFSAPGGFLFKLGNPQRVEWYAQGREATRGEVLESIESGLPSLIESIEQEAPKDRPGALAELERLKARALTLLPA
jgi:hypothetical protein